ncbi:MAG: sigma-70 family RNA polymerase sigma factor [Saprospiraceae bacterium]|nr:MAG: sigma-70 family RNA polymerase sigma factor [Bacteroidetes bacterium OLB9]MCO6463773.1 sigma-70 family RNA polymerase sigma factor [Saprospiraceae bacterium]MCZ2338158.1 sigma-70 family RNA polymerase sigma factor [Chitinophagales bacterium]
MSLEDIIKGCKEGNRKCQDALVQKFAPGLLSLCIRYTSDHELGRDALQECFINVFKYIHTYRGDGSFEGWLKRIAVTASLALKTKFRKFRFDEVQEDNTWHYAELPDIYGSMNIEEIIQVMQQLPESLFLVFNLHVVEGFHHNEIADMLGITESTSRAALSKARNRMISLLKKIEVPAIVEAS